MMEYAEQAEGLRVVKAGNSSYKIVLNRDDALWDIQTEAGPLPVALRDKRYTSHNYALLDIKNYLDGHAERKLVYKVERKKD